MNLCWVQPPPQLLTCTSFWIQAYSSLLSGLLQLLPPLSSEPCYLAALLKPRWIWCHFEACPLVQRGLSYIICMAAGAVGLHWVLYPHLDSPCWAPRLRKL